MKYGVIGGLTFEVAEYNEHTEDCTFVYAKHETIEAPSSLQFMGTDLRTHKLSLRWHREWCEPKTQFNNLVKIAKEGQPLRLVIAQQYHGKFVIEGISSSFEKTDSKGNAVYISAEISMTEYVEKSVQTKQIETKKQGQAVKTNVSSNIKKGSVRR